MTIEIVSIEQPPVASTIGDKVRQARLEAGYSKQAQLAESLHVADSWVASIEAGEFEPSRWMRVLLADALHVTSDYFRESKPE